MFLSIVFIEACVSFIQIETISIKKKPVEDVPATKKTKTKIKQLKTKSSATDVIIGTSKSNLELTSSNHVAPSKRRQTTLITNIVKRPSSHTSRSHSAHTGHEQVNHYNMFSPPSSSSTQQWNVTTYYPPNYHTSREEKQTKYITEIYDKATNRFIQTTC